MIYVVFYAKNGQAAKDLAAQLRVGKRDQVLIYDVNAWDDRRRECDVVEIMSDVTEWQRRKIYQSYPELESQISKNEQQTGDADPGDDSRDSDPGDAGHESQTAVVPLTAVHRGRGDWYVMRGEQEVSGPHPKSEAHRLAGGSS